VQVLLFESEVRSRPPFSRSLHSPSRSVADVESEGSERPVIDVRGPDLFHLFPTVFPPSLLFRRLKPSFFFYGDIDPLPSPSDFFREVGTVSRLSPYVSFLFIYGFLASFARALAN